MKAAWWAVLGALAWNVAGCRGSDKAQNVFTPPNGGTTASIGTLPDGGADGRTTAGALDASADARLGWNDPGANTGGRDAGAHEGLEGGVNAHSLEDAGPACVEPLAAGVQLERLELNQAVAVPLVQDGEAPWPRNAPVVQGRDALVRAFVQPLEGTAPQPIRAALTLVNGTEQTVLEAEGTPQQGDDAVLSSTYNFEVEGALIGPDTRFRFALLQEDCEGPLGEPSDARFPAEDEDAPLEAEQVGVLRVVFVPIAYETTSWTGTQVIEPDTSERAVARYRDALMAFFPVSAVEVRVREALPWDADVDASGSGWELLLDGVLGAREDDLDEGLAEVDEYYYGLFRPPGRVQTYCDPSCVAGLAPVPQTGGFGGGPRATGGLGLAFDDALSRETLVHELGHAHGRDHSPCGFARGVDPEFPYEEGGLGVWGYDIVDSWLKSPAAFADMMGYCAPIWVSDYTFEGLSDWVAAVNGAEQPRVFSPKRLVSQRWRSLLLLEDGPARWGAWKPALPPQGEPVAVEVLDARGLTIDRFEGVRVPLSDSGSAYLFVPEPDADWDTLRFAGRELALEAL